MAIPDKNTPWMSADAYGQSLRSGLGVNLLVKDLDQAARFQVDIFGAEIMFWTENFAVMHFGGSQWMLHQDETYRNNALIGILRGAETRGAGIELRLYGCNPDQAEAKARAHDDAIILAGAMDKPHGQREAVIIDPDGYAWVPGIPI